jgi:hypothetical protein
MGHDESIEKASLQVTASVLGLLLVKYCSLLLQQMTTASFLRKFWRLLTTWSWLQLPPLFQGAVRFLSQVGSGPKTRQSQLTSPWSAVGGHRSALSKKPNYETVLISPKMRSQDSWKKGFVNNLPCQQWMATECLQYMPPWKTLLRMCSWLLSGTAQKCTYTEREKSCTNSRIST